MKKIYYKFIKWLKILFDFNIKLNEEELFAIEICKNLIIKDNVQMFISPISHKRYLKDDANGMFVIIDNQNINIMNHVYSYTINIFHMRHIEDLNKTFDLELEQRRINLENEVKLNIQHSLKNLLKEINNEK